MVRPIRLGRFENEEKHVETLGRAYTSTVLALTTDGFYVAKKTVVRRAAQRKRHTVGCASDSSGIEELTYWSAIRLLIFFSTSETSPFILYQRLIRYAPPRKPKILRTTYTVKILVDGMSTLKSVLKNEIPIVNRNTPKFRCSELGEPLVKVSSSCSVISYNDNESTRPRTILTSLSPVLSSPSFIRDYL